MADLGSHCANKQHTLLRLLFIFHYFMRQQWQTKQWQAKPSNVIDNDYTGIVKDMHTVSIWPPLAILAIAAGFTHSKISRARFKILGAVGL